MDLCEEVNQEAGLKCLIASLSTEKKGWLLGSLSTEQKGRLFGSTTLYTGSVEEKNCGNTYIICENDI